MSQVEDRLIESRQANNMLIKKLSQAQKKASRPTPIPTSKKSFRNFESEMEDYEPVEEEKEEESDKEETPQAEEEEEEEESEVEVADAA